MRKKGRHILAEKISRTNMKTEGKKCLFIVVLSFLYGATVNWLITPYGLYAGGLLGVCQLIRSIINEQFGIHPNFDYAGLLYYAVNIPLMLMVKKVMGRRYLFKTILCISAQSLAMAFLPIPAVPPIENALAACLLGGILRGALIGLCMRYGANDGGMDLVGIMMLHKDSNVTVGGLNLVINIIVYVVMALRYNLTIVAFSLISAAVMSYGLDRFYSQGINVEMHIITRGDSKELEQRINHELRRGVTTWNGVGAYAGKEVHILYVILNKYEVASLRRLVRLYDPEAFVVENQGVKVGGNYEKHLS